MLDPELTFSRAPLFVFNSFVSGFGCVQLESDTFCYRVLCPPPLHVMVINQFFKCVLQFVNVELRQPHLILTQINSGEMSFT